MNETVKKVDIYCREKNFIKLSSYCKFIIMEQYADIEFNSRYWIWPQDTEFELNEDVDVDEILIWNSTHMKMLKSIFMETWSDDLKLIND